jgi:hypothetical protein
MTLLLPSRRLVTCDAFMADVVRRIVWTSVSATSSSRAAAPDVERLPSRLDGL